jgi:pimeloyl-ACP methyl ester carboxylesterase
MNTVTGALQHAASQANIDPARIYLIGHSSAATAVWNLALLYPTYFTAINPLAAGPLADWQRVRLTNLHNLLIVQWHDADDKIAKPEPARTVAATLQRLKVDIDFTESHGIGHDPTPAILDQCYDKLLARRRDLYPNQIEMYSNRPDTAFNRIDWFQIYQPLAPGQELRDYFQRVPGHMTLTSNSWSAHAFIANNHINITTDNVALLRIYLNDQLVDLHEPVIVIVNNQVRFEGIVPQSLKEMLNDQLFLGRGWRYFTAVIDIDLTAKPATTQSAR